MRLILALLGMCLALLSSACDSATNEATDDASYVRVPMPEVIVDAGESVQLTMPSSLAGSGAVTWQSSNTSVAQVTSSGLVSALDAGQAQITGRTKRHRAVFPVTVDAVETVPTVTSIAVTPATVDVTVSGTAQLTAEARDQNGDVMVGVSFTWESQNPEVATVSASGLVTAVAAGNVTITARSGEVTGTATVNVPVPAAVLTTIELTPPSASLVAGATAQLTAVAKDQSGNVMSGVTFTWSTANPAVATVSASGMVWAVAAGQVAITATSGEKSASANVTVTLAAPALTSVEVSPATVSVTTGVTSQLSAVAKDQHGNTMDGVSFTWASSKTAFATVSTSGLVTGVAAGTATITATSGGKSATSAVTVTAPAAVLTSVAVTPATVSLTSGGNAQLSAAGKDQNGGSLSVPFVWTSSDPAIATVNNSGLVTAVAPGSAKITATSGGLEASAAVTVAAPPVVLTVTTVTLAPTSATVAVGATRQLTATVRDQNGNTMSGQTVIWSSSNAPVASVSSSGVVSGVVAGSATITGTVAGKSGTSQITVSAPAPPPPAAAASSGIWISQEEIKALPMSGAGWSNVKSAADATCGTPNLSNQDDPANVCVLAKAMVYVRTGGAGYRDGVVSALRSIVNSGTYTGRALALGRELPAYVIAADIINLASVDPALDAQFRAKIDELRTTTTDGGPASIVACNNTRPNNWGTWCGAARVAVALYLGDKADFDKAVLVMRGWMGDRSAYSSFTYGDLWWQADASSPVGINPKGATKDGHNIDGVLPDDQRRCGTFAWPPCVTDYIWGALEGAIVTAGMMQRQGLPAFDWSDRALLRAYTWLYNEGGNPAAGNDAWQPYLVNYMYGSSFPMASGASPGKNMGWTDWTHARR